MSTHRAILTFTDAAGDESVTAVTLDVDDLDVEGWSAQILSTPPRTPRGAPRAVVVTIGARKAPAEVTVDDGRIVRLDGRGAFARP